MTPKALSKELKTSLSFNQDGSIDVMRHVGELEILTCTDESLADSELEELYELTRENN